MPDTAFDSFNRADDASILGTADSGQAWTALSGTWGIASNQARKFATSSQQDIAVIDGGIADGSVSATFAVMGQEGGLIARASDDNNYILLVVAGSTIDDLVLYKRVSGTFTQIGQASASLIDGDRVRLRCSGTSIIAYVNGAQVLSVTESHNLTATKWGLRSYLTTARFEDFSIDRYDFAAADRSATAVFNAYDVGDVELTAVGYDRYAAAERSLAQVRNDYAISDRSQWGVLAEFAATDVSNARILEPFAAADRSLHRQFNAYLVRDRSAYRILLACAASDQSHSRLANNALDRFEIFRGVDGEPDLDAAPWQTIATLPFTTPALNPDHVYNFVVRRRNRWGLSSQNIASSRFEIDADGNLVSTRPSDATDIAAAAQAGGIVRISARYAYAVDGAAQANTWLIYRTLDGSTPTTLLTPLMIPMRKSDGVARLRYDTAALANGTVVKAIVRTRRTALPANIDSLSTDIVTATATDTGPSAVTRPGAFLGTVAQQQQ